MSSFAEARTSANSLKMQNGVKNDVKYRIYIPLQKSLVLCVCVCVAFYALTLSHAHSRTFTWFFFDSFLSFQAIFHLAIINNKYVAVFVEKLFVE